MNRKLSVNSYLKSPFIVGTQTTLGQNVTLFHTQISQMILARAVAF